MRLSWICRLSERSPSACKSGVTIWLSPLVVANDEAQMKTLANAVKNMSIFAFLRMAQRLSPPVRRVERRCFRLHRALTEPLHRQPRDLPRIFKLQLFFNVGAMGLHGFRTNPERIGNFANF